MNTPRENAPHANAARMDTPIADFVRRYADSGTSRLHMPGHKGNPFLGCEAYDITEIAGADSLYEADGIIAKSEANAARLFGSRRTLYSTEGSSQCIRAMLYLLIEDWAQRADETCKDAPKTGGRYEGEGRYPAGAQRVQTRPLVLAARNAHKAFLYAAALLDFDVRWLYPSGDSASLCACAVSPDELARELRYQGNNLNQLTLLARQGRVEQINYEPFMEAYKNVWQALNSLQSRKA